MTITNDTLVWLGPVVGAIVMTVTSIVTGYFDTRRPSQVSPTTPEGDVELAISADDTERIVRRAARAPNSPRPTPAGPTPKTRPTVR